MKKIFALLLAVACISVMAISVSAEHSLLQEFEIPKAAAAPTLDGVMSDGEWDGALAIPVNIDTTQIITGTEESLPSAVYYYMWDDAGLYLFFDVDDKTDTGVYHTGKTGSYNSGDGIQLNIYPDTSITGSSIGDMYFISIVVDVDEEVCIGDHFVYGDGGSGGNVPGAVGACTLDDAAYKMEVFIPAEAFAESTTPIKFEAGTTFGLANILMNSNGTGDTTLACDSAWFNDANSVNTYTFAAGAEPEVVYTYPASGESGDIISGSVIGYENGWGDNPDAGRAAAFDGNPATFYDPMGVGDGYVGVDAGESYILDKVAILSRDGFADRFKGAEIRGSNEDDVENAVTLWKSDAEAASTTEYTVITDFENNTGYQYYFYYNTENHGDVAEVEFYGHAGAAEETVDAAEEAPEVEDIAVDTALEEKMEDKAAQTFDFGVIAAVAAVVSLAGFAVSKKH